MSDFVNSDAFSNNRRGSHSRQSSSSRFNASNINTTSNDNQIKLVDIGNFNIPKLEDYFNNNNKNNTNGRVNSTNRFSNSNQQQQENQAPLRLATVTSSIVKIEIPDFVPGLQQQNLVAGDFMQQPIQLPKMATESFLFQDEKNQDKASSLESFLPRGSALSNNSNKPMLVTTQQHVGLNSDFKMLDPEHDQYSPPSRRNVEIINNNNKNENPSQQKIAKNEPVPAFEPGATTTATRSRNTESIPIFLPLATSNAETPPSANNVKKNNNISASVEDHHMNSVRTYYEQRISELETELVKTKQENDNLHSRERTREHSQNTSLQSATAPMGLFGQNINNNAKSAFSSDWYANANSYPSTSPIPTTTTSVFAPTTLTSSSLSRNFNNNNNNNNYNGSSSYFNNNHNNNQNNNQNYFGGNTYKVNLASLSSSRSSSTLTNNDAYYNTNSNNGRASYFPTSRNGATTNNGVYADRRGGVVSPSRNRKFSNNDTDDSDNNEKTASSFRNNNSNKQQQHQHFHLSAHGNNNSKKNNQEFDSQNYFDQQELFDDLVSHNDNIEKVNTNNNNNANNPKPQKLVKDATLTASPEKFFTFEDELLREERSQNQQQQENKKLVQHEHQQSFETEDRRKRNLSLNRSLPRQQLPQEQPQEHDVGNRSNGGNIIYQPNSMNYFENPAVVLGASRNQHQPSFHSARQNNTNIMNRPIVADGNRVIKTPYEQNLELQKLQDLQKQQRSQPRQRTFFEPSAQNNNNYGTGERESISSSNNSQQREVTKNKFTPNISVERQQQFQPRQQSADDSVMALL